MGARSLPQRRDGRSPQQLRAMTAEIGVLSRADGSARYAQGNTVVLAAVHGPTVVPMRRELLDRATIEVSVRRVSAFSDVHEQAVARAAAEHGEEAPVTAASSSSRAKDSFLFDRSAEYTVSGILSSCVDSTQYPRTLIVVAVQVLSLDGSLVPAVLHAAALALCDAGVAMRGLPLGINVRLHSEDALLLDTTLEEEECGDSITAAFLSHTLQQGAVAALEFCGEPLSNDALAHLLSVARTAVVKYQAFLRVVAERKTMKELGLSQVPSQSK